MLSLLKKGPSANKVPAEKIQATYGRYRMQALLSVFLGYLAYYIVRNNFTLSTPYLKEQLDLSATQIGLLSSCMLIAYGISKGVMSSLADKASPKVFMACGLVLCAIVNVGLGFSTAFWVFAALVVLNGLFQGMGIEQDVGCITAWAKARAPGLTLLAIGHSIGGHAVLLSSASTDLRAAVMVASHAGVTSTISQTKEKLRVWCLLRVLGPALCRLFGYMPARRLGLGEDLPAPAMLQWGRWSAMPEYFYDDPEWDARQRAGKITLPILVLGFDDDPWANTEAISRLLAPAQNAKIERREIRRADYGLSSIGHMGFFRTRNAEKLWPLVAQWLERHCPDKRRTT
ncbi:MFS transporter [Klebsiella pneumoniae]